MSFDALEVFSVTKAADRDRLGDRITAWLRRTEAEVVDVVVRQSSCREFHCLSILFFVREGGPRPAGSRPRRP